MNMKKIGILIVALLLLTGGMFLPSGFEETLMYVGGKKYLDRRQTEGIVYEIQVGKKQIDNKFRGFQNLGSVDSLAYSAKSNKLFITGSQRRYFGERKNIPREGDLEIIKLDKYRKKHKQLDEIHGNLKRAVISPDEREIYFRNPDINKEYTDITLIFDSKNWRIIKKSGVPISQEGKLSKNSKYYGLFSPGQKIVWNVEKDKEINRILNKKEIIQSGGLHFPDEKIEEPFCYADSTENGDEVAVYDRDTLERKFSLNIREQFDQNVVQVQPQLSRLKITPDNKYCVVPLLYRPSAHEPPGGLLTFLDLKRQKFVGTIETAPNLTHPVFRQRSLKVWEVIWDWLRQSLH